MGYEEERLEAIFVKCDGHCHICGKKLSRCNYGEPGAHGAWEVPARIPCNRKKRAGSTRSARAHHGRGAALLHRGKKQEVRRRNALIGAATGGLSALAVGASGPVGWLTAGVGALIGHNVEPDPQKGKRRT